MSSPIDPIRRSGRLRRSAHTAPERLEEAEEAAGARLPGAINPQRAAPPRAAAPGAAGAFDAQLLGQDGQKRGLRGGPAVIDSAAASYNRTEWSGSKDRRARKGGLTKTQI